MKLLFDQNISFWILRHIEEIFPGSGQVRQLALQDESDARIFEFARAHGYAVVTFDADFVDLCIV